MTMSGILIEKPGGVEVLSWKEDLAVPELKEGQILVKNEFAGVNYIDTCARSRVDSMATEADIVPDTSVMACTNQNILSSQGRKPPVSW